MIRWISIVLAVVGLCIGVYAVATAQEKKIDLPLARPAAVNPYEKGVAALGIIEPSGRDVAIAAPEAGLVSRVLVDVGDSVAVGDVLFQLDTRVLDADLVRAGANVVAARAEVDRWHAIPRAEDLPPLEASVAQARAVLSDRDDQLRLVQSAFERGANTDRDVSSARFARDNARAGLERAEADLARLRAGGWKADLVVAEAALKQREGEVAALELLKERLTVRAPRTGKVLRRSIEPGEFATSSPSQPAMILGDLSKLNVRAQVDEEDIGFIAPARQGGATTSNSLRAVARVRGGGSGEFPLRLLRIEPYARPKSDLLGSNVERVDTRVIDVVFEIETLPDAAIFPGQAVDVFIEARE
jgi:HlyD family secretion protein